MVRKFGVRHNDFESTMCELELSRVSRVNGKKIEVELLIFAPRAKSDAGVPSMRTDSLLV